MAPGRTDRLSGSGPPPDQRNAFQVDRDRILYCTAFRRLAGVTQVVSPGEGEKFLLNHPALAAHQHGPRRAIRTLFEVFNEAAEKMEWALFPAHYREEAVELTRQQGSIPPDRRARLVADTIAALTDQQALRLCQRLSGLAPGSALDPIVS